jgi:LPXTG-motif cell wall-anchored protein
MTHAQLRSVQWLLLLGLPGAVLLLGLLVWVRRRN